MTTTNEATTTHDGPPCYACGAAAGEDYHSDRRTDTAGWGDVALILCGGCADKGEALPDDEALAFYRAGVRWSTVAIHDYYTGEILGRALPSQEERYLEELANMAPWMKATGAVEGDAYGYPGKVIYMLGAGRAAGIALERVAPDALCLDLRREAERTGGEAYRARLLGFPNAAPLDLLWVPGAIGGRAGVAWGSYADWTDAGSPADAVRRYLAGEMAE